MDRRTRICVWIILIGLANFLAYSILYAWVYGEAVHGEVRVIEGERQYVLHSGKERPRWVFIYSGVHSISIWPTVAAVMLAMLTIAKDRIISSAYSTARRGRAMITVLAVVIAIVMCFLTFLFTRNFDDIARAAREGTAPCVSGIEAKKSVEVICAIYQSARTGKPVSLPLKEFNP